MILKPPFIITARLMAGVKVGGGYISIGQGERNSEGRTQYGVYIDLPDGSEHEIDDLKSGCGGGGVQDGMAALLSFLSAAAESYSFRDCNWDNNSEDDNALLFPRPVVEWAYQNSDEIAMLEVEISETPDLITQ